jgi:ABC-2 type transport system permease protein
VSATATRSRTKYFAVYALAVRQTIERRGELVGRAIFYCLLLLVFSGLWKAVYAMGALAETPSTFLWYLAVTEWITLAVPLTHHTVEQDVKTGDVAYHLARPMSYLGLRVAEALGALTVRLVVLAGVGFVAAVALAGSLPSDPWGLLFAIPLGVVAAAVTVVWLATIGLTAFWIQDASALHWVVQKLMFVLGGLILPLSIYPVWLRRIAELLPFAAVLYGPGRMAFGLDPWALLDSTVKLLAWGAVSVWLALYVFRRARLRLEVNGG